VGVRVGMTRDLRELNLRCPRSARICMPRRNLRNLHASSQLSSFCSFGDISVYIVGPVTDMARSPRLVILIKNKFTLRIRNATSCLLHTFRRMCLLHTFWRILYNYGFGNVSFYLLHTFRRIWSNLLLYEKRVWKHQCNNLKKNVNFFPIIPIEPIVVRSGLYKPIIQPAIKIRLLGRFHPNSFKSERLVA